MVSPCRGLNSSQELNRSLSFTEKLEQHLSATDNDCDVVFSVGPENEKIRAVRLVLVVSSPVFKYLFEDSWDHLYHTISHEGIPLTDVDPDAFRIFLKLLLWDDLSTEKISSLQLSPKNLFNLVEIAKKYGMTEMQASLETIVDQFFKNINKFVSTEEFLTLPRNILGLILNRDSLPMDEVAVFQCACKWAEYQCIAHGFEQSGTNIRGMLDDYLYSIRFPVMSIKDFGNRVCPVNILTPEEELKVFKYISAAEKDRSFIDVTNFPFNVNRRKRCDPVVATNTNSGLAKSQRSKAKLNVSATASGDTLDRSDKRRVTRSETSVPPPGQNLNQGRNDHSYATRTSSPLNSSANLVTAPTQARTKQNQGFGRRGRQKSQKQKPVTPKQKSAGILAASLKSSPRQSASPSPTPSSLNQKGSEESQKRLVRNGPTAKHPRKKTDELPLTSALADGAFVKVTYRWNCGKVSLCADEDSPHYDVLEEMLGIYAKAAPPMDRVPEMNEIVVVPDNRGRYYRGVVTGFRGEDGVKIEFLDYGGETMVDSSELRELNDEINSYPTFAIKFRLKDVPENAFNLNVSKNPEILDAMKNGGRIEVLKKGTGMWTGKLWLSDNRSWSDVIMDAMKKR